MAYVSAVLGDRPHFISGARTDYTLLSVCGCVFTPVVVYLFDGSACYGDFQICGVTCLYWDSLLVRWMPRLIDRL